MANTKEHMQRIAKLPRLRKLNSKQKEAIRMSNVEPVRLAVKYGVSIRTIYRYKNGK